jgi:hypothetical protein
MLIVSSWRPPADQLLPENAGKTQGQRMKDSPYL